MANDILLLAVQLPPPLPHRLCNHTKAPTRVENLLANQRAVVIGVVHRHGVVVAVVVVLDVEVGERQTHRVIGDDSDEPRAVDAVRVHVRIAWRRKATA